MSGDWPLTTGYCLLLPPLFLRKSLASGSGSMNHVMPNAVRHLRATAGEILRLHGTFAEIRS